MANVLEFALGLETGGFVTKVLSAEAALGGLKKMAEGIEFVFRKMDQSIERAAALEALHKRTGESVGTLYQLQEAFKAVELSADTVPTTILRIQRALSGVNEMGLSTSTAFARLHLNIGSLKNLDATAQIDAIAGALARMPKEQATGLASQLFGRFGMGDMLQISRSGAQFDEALSKARQFAGIYNLLAPLAEKYERTLSYAKMQWEAIWSEVALQLLPVLQEVLDKVQRLNVTKFAQNLGDAIRAIEEAFAEGKITDLIEAGFEAALELMINVIGGTLGSGSFWGGIWDVMVGRFKVEVGVMMELMLNFGEYIRSIFDSAVQHLILGISKVPILGKKLGLEGFEPDSFEDIYARNKAEGKEAQPIFGDIRRSGVQQMASGAEEIFKAGVDAVKNSGGPAQEAFVKMVRGLSSRAPTNRAGEAPGAAGPQDNASLSMSHYRPQFISLEKMGFVMGGAGTALNYQRRAADAAEGILHYLVAHSGAPQPASSLTDV